MLMRVFSETIDVFKGFQYVIPQRLASHQSPYVKVRWQNQGVAYILLKTKKIEFYDTAPLEVRNQIDIIENWIEKNYNICRKIWNKYNEAKI